MTARATEAAAGLERFRLQLEENVEKLRKALQHWQIWEAEYEALKEEVESLPQDVSPNELVKSALAAQGKLVDEKETKEILGLQKGAPRTAQQVIGLVDRRIDYVQKNVASIQKQVDAAEMKLYNVDAIQQETRNEEGLPLTEISEELDDEDNVISAELSHPGDAPGKVLETLKKLGIEEKDLAEDQAELEAEDTPTTDLEVASISPISQPTGKVKSEQGAEVPSKKKAKNVSFASELDIAPNTSFSKSTTESASSNIDSVSAQNLSSKASAVEPAKLDKIPSVPGITKLAAGSFPAHSRVIELDENDLPIAVNAPADPIKNPVIPPNESEEDAQLRRQMLQYSMSEVGAVVAQMDIEERGSDESEFSDENYDIDEDDADDYDYGSGVSTDDEEDDDEHGLSHKSRITTSYRQKMEALERKLNAQMLENLGPRSEEEILRVANGTFDTEDDMVADARVLRVQKDDRDKHLESEVSEQPRGDDSASEGKKGVRFAQALDTASSDSSRSHQPTSAKADEAVPVTPFSNTIEELQAEPQQQSTTEAPRKQSRFKATRAKDTGAAPQALPPHNPHPLADVVVERQPRSQAAIKPPSRHDAQLRDKELGMEYLRQRNNMIYNQGGFLQDANDEHDAEVDADEDGKPVKRMSRFMAARVRGP